MFLGIDTATSTGVIGLYQKEMGIRGEISFRIKRGHGKIFNSILAQLFSHLDLKPGEITGVAVGLGPGSFTGTRVGITLARSLALALDIPVWGLSTLEGLAWNGGSSEEREILSLLDARNERVYWGLYAWEKGRPCRLLGDDAASVAELGPLLEKHSSRLMLIGEYPNYYRDLLAGSFSGSIVTPVPVHNQLRGGIIAYAGYLASLNNTSGDSLEKIVPRYLKEAI